MIKSAGDTGNKNRRHKNGGKHESYADDRTRDLLHCLKGSVAGRHAFLDVTLDCFDHDDGIIDDETNCEDEAKK